MFEHLDDAGSPTPPAAAVIAARGLAIRNRRRYAAAGAAATLGVALLLATTLPGSPPRDDTLELAEDPTPSPTATSDPPAVTSTPSPSPSASPAPTAEPSTATSRPAGPPRTVEPSPSTSPVSGFFAPALTPQRRPQPAIAACTPGQVAETHPAGTAPPAGVVLTAEITSWTAKTTSRGAYWVVDLTIRNTTDAPVTFEDRGRAGGVYLGGRYVAGRPEGESPYPQPPSGGTRTLAPGESVVIEQIGVSTWTCARDVSLPYGGYDLSVGIRTESGTWYAPAIRGWVGAMSSGESDCFRYDDAPGRIAPAAGLTLTVEGVPARAATPDASFTARLVVTNTSSRPVELVDLEPGRRVAYLMRQGRGPVTGGWTVGRDEAARTYRLAAGERRVFDVPVRAEGCQTAQPIYGTWHGVVVGLVTVRDGQPYLWTARGGDITYPG